MNRLIFLLAPRFLSLLWRGALTVPQAWPSARGVLSTVRPARAVIILSLLIPFAPLFAAAPTKPFELRDGDRVVFLGDTLMEREKDFGYIELMMTLRFPDRNVTFRNLGWSADTPVGISRVSFDWPKGEGEMFRQLMEQIKQVQPTVVVLGYGMASSLEDAAATEMEARSRILNAPADRGPVSPHPGPLAQGEGDAASRAATKQAASIGQETGGTSPLSPGERAGVRGNLLRRQ
jgi:hypothetical protein